MIALLSASAFPIADREKTRQRIMLTGDASSPMRLLSGHMFHPPCWKAQAICRTKYLELTVKPGAGVERQAACHVLEQMAS